MVRNRKQRMLEFKESMHGAQLSDLPKSQVEATKLGARYFFTGRPCGRGHVFMRYTAGGRCAYCQREANARKAGKVFDPTVSRAASHAARVNAINSEQTTYVPTKPCKHGHYLRYVSSNNCVPCHHAAIEKRKIDNRFVRFRKEYGLSKSEYLHLVKSQESSCAVCGSHEPDHFKLHVDHCHDSGKVRGLLCGKCNQGIGLFGEDKQKMLAAIEYLELHNAA